MCEKLAFMALSKENLKWKIFNFYIIILLSNCVCTWEMLYQKNIQHYKEKPRCDCSKQNLSRIYILINYLWQEIHYIDNYKIIWIEYFVSDSEWCLNIHTLVGQGEHWRLFPRFARVKTIMNEPIYLVTYKWFPLYIPQR